MLIDTTGTATAVTAARSDASCGFVAAAVSEVRGSVVPSTVRPRIVVEPVITLPDIPEPVDLPRGTTG